MSLVKLKVGAQTSMAVGVLEHIEYSSILVKKRVMGAVYRTYHWSGFLKWIVHCIGAV